MSRPVRLRAAGPATRVPPPRLIEAIVRERHFVALGLLLVLVFLFGGGSRGDIQSVAYLRAAAILGLAFGLSSLTAAQVTSHRFLFGLAAASVTLVLLHLLPLPPQVWRGLPGREIVGVVDREASLGAPWRPLTLAPAATRNALWALAAPLAVLVLGVQLTSAQRARLLPLIISLGVLSALIGLLQLLGDPRGPLYFYEITNNGSPVGLFANRNHQAVFLATVLAMLLVWTNGRQRHGARARQRWPSWLPAAAMMVFVVPLILIIGSRSGLVVSLIALLLAALIPAGLHERKAPGSGKGLRVRPWYYVLPAALVAMAVLTVLLGRGFAIDRLLASGAAEDLRLRILPQLLAMISAYAPLGSGFGTFDYVYRLDEPFALLGPTYMNHAHNDWLEVVLSGGVPAAALLLAAVAAFLRRSVQLFGPTARDRDALLLGRLGLLVILVLGLASLSDYPLRVPSLACLAVVAALWAGSGKARTESPGQSV